MQILHDDHYIEVDTLPDICPYCHTGIKPNVISSFVVNFEEKIILQLFLNCPISYCHESFIAYFSKNSYVSKFKYLEQTTQGNLIVKTFSDAILNISESFVIIYNQSYSAEQQGLLEICGVGYRKSLEFLIKDYAVIKNSSEHVNIAKKKLAHCIRDYVTDERIKSVVKRAVWLGNDETHYVRKWEGKNLIDLKKLIDLTLHWIEAEVLTESFEDEMPD